MTIQCMEPRPLTWLTASRLSRRNNQKPPGATKANESRTPRRQMSRIVRRVCQEQVLVRIRSLVGRAGLTPCRKLIKHPVPDRLLLQKPGCARAFQDRQRRQEARL